MSPKHEGLLDQAHWEKVEDWRPAVKRRWSFGFMRPSWLKRGRSPPEQLRRTAYLDGLRGFAALLVYWGHHQLWARDAMRPDRIFENAYGYDGQYYFACLPVIRTFFSGGHFSVTTFLIISGYVLSAKPLALIQAGDYSKLSENVASALFRRWLRLYLPIIVTTFLYMTSWHAFKIWTDQEHQPNYRAEIWKWYCDFKIFSFVFDTSGNPWFHYNGHLWSIPVEFKGSIIIYTTVLALSRCTRNARLWCELGLIYYFMYIVDGWYGAMFIAGMLMCDLDLLAEDGDLPHFFSQLKPGKTVIFYSLFLMSIFLGGVPSNSADLSVLQASPGWYYASFLKPQAVYDYKWFFLFWAATFLVASARRIWWLKSFFETPFNQYLGRISFAFYLIHGPVLWTIGDRLYVAVGWYRDVHLTALPHWVNKVPLSKWGPLGLEFSFLLPHLIILPLTLWLAELVTKLIDEPSLRFSQWAYRKTLAPAES